MVHDTGEGCVCLKCQNSAEILFMKIIVLLFCCGGNLHPSVACMQAQR